jgi:hypothetical protein
VTDLNLPVPRDTRSASTAHGGERLPDAILDWRPGAPVTVEFLEEALVMMAYVVTTHGEIYACLFDRIEAELATARKRQSTLERASQIVARYTAGGALKAIR